LPWCRGSHLILIPALTGWLDQGQFTDVMVHLGTLLAILIYFWRDVIRLIKGARPEAREPVAVRALSHGARWLSAGAVLQLMRAQGW
jgi:undecaprenyl pyrophosphate phosphatase UppP